MKPLLFGMFLASPAVAAWIIQDSRGETAKNVQAVSYGMPVNHPVPVTKVAVEVMEKGSAPRTIYIDVETHAVPEPGMVSLLVLTASLFIFRRQRN